MVERDSRKPSPRPRNRVYFPAPSPSSSSSSSANLLVHPPFTSPPPPPNAQSIRTQIDCRIIIENTSAAGSRRFFFPLPFCHLPRGHTINSLSFADMPLEISSCYLELFTRHCPIPFNLACPCKVACTSIGR